jgi:hypothetical protein
MVKKVASSNPVQKGFKKSVVKRKKITEDVKQIEAEEEVLDTAVIDSNEIKRRVQNILQKTRDSLRNKISSKKQSNTSKKKKKVTQKSKLSPLNLFLRRVKN